MCEAAAAADHGDVEKRHGVEAHVAQLGRQDVSVGMDKTVATETKQGRQRQDQGFENQAREIEQGKEKGPAAA